MAEAASVHPLNGTRSVQGYLVLEIAVFLGFRLSLLRIGFLPQSRQGREGVRKDKNKTQRSSPRPSRLSVSLHLKTFHHPGFAFLRDLGDFAVNRMRKASVDGAGFQKVQNEGTLAIRQRHLAFLENSRLCEICVLWTNG
ncbi:MAG: hypothetical protein QM627_10660 [Luteolibacter sp.]